MIIRLYTGGDGQAHFEDLNMPAGEAETVALKSGGEMTFRSFPDGSFSDSNESLATRRKRPVVTSGKTASPFPAWSTLITKFTIGTK